MIPLLGVPVLNREDLAVRMVESVDYPVDELLVVLNMKDKDTALSLIGDAARRNRNIRKVSFSLPSFNLGCGGSWNHIIRHRPVGPWWFIVNADIEFAAGDLELLVTGMTDSAEVRTLFEFGAFAVTSACVDAVGWFDENLHPMYFEDNDYKRRMKVAGVPLHPVAGGTRHDNSSTIGSDARYALRNQETFMENAKYYLAKWGGQPGQEKFDVPFDGKQPVNLQRVRLARQSW